MSKLLERLREAAGNPLQGDACILSISAVIEAADRIAKLEAALAPFADIGVGTNPDYAPMIRLPREAILRAREALGMS